MDFFYLRMYRLNFDLVNVFIINLVVNSFPAVLVYNVEVFIFSYGISNNI